MSGFTSNDTNAFFNDCMNAILQIKDEMKVDDETAIYSLEKFHYFSYAIFVSNASPNQTLIDIYSFFNFDTISSSLVEISYSKEKGFASLESLVNLTIRSSPEDLKNIQSKTALKKNAKIFSIDDVLEVMLEKYLDGKIPSVFVKKLGKILEAKASYSLILKAIKSYETASVFHSAPESRPRGSAYTGIGESWQKQSISTNAGWVARIKMIFEFGKNWSQVGSLGSVNTKVKAVTPNKILPKIGDPSMFILLGPPGTGKTRASKIIANMLINQEVVPLKVKELQMITDSQIEWNNKLQNLFSSQFHPSFSYEDFLEGLRPIQLIDNGKTEVSYEIIPGVFKIVSQLGRAYFDKSYGIEFRAKFENGSINKWLNDDSSLVSQYGILNRDGFFSLDGEVIAYTGNEEHETELSESRNGYFKIKWYTSSEVQHFVVFIDELNRGNPAKIFGEALSLIESSKRMSRKEEGALNLPYSKEKLLVPPNVHIICAMNSSDKSLAHLDQAFRRRFKSLYFEPNFETLISDNMKEQFGEVGCDEKILIWVKKHFEIINESLELCDIGVDCHIGHSYALELLREVYRMCQNIKNPNVESILLTRLEQCWNKNLHNLLRDILTEYKIQEFCERFTELSVKNASELGVLSSSEFFAKLFNKYLSSASSEGNEFPWKKAS